MTRKPFETYPEDRETLISLALTVQTSSDVEATEKAADKLSDLVLSILSDEDTDDFDRELDADDLAMIDAAWEKHKAAGPVAKVINDNQPGNTAIIEILRDPPTLGVGTLLFSTLTNTSRDDEAPVAWVSSSLLILLELGSRGAFNTQVANTKFRGFDIPLYSAPQCPRPMNSRPVHFPAADCVAAGECGCGKDETPHALIECLERHVEEIGHTEIGQDIQAAIGVLRHLSSIARPQSAAVMDGTSKAANDVLAERRRQVEAEGWTPEHDDRYAHGEMAGAAVCYAVHNLPSVAHIGVHRSYWPWDEDWFKPTSYRLDLVKAAALIIAEIERLDRAALLKTKEA
jgi:hypothetical protein